MQFDPVTFLENILPLMNHQDTHVRYQSQSVANIVFGPNMEFWLKRIIHFHPQAEQQQLARNILKTLDMYGQDGAASYSLHIQCLGEFEVLHNTHTITNWDPSRRSGARLTRALLAYLTHCGPAGATEEEIMRALWKDTNPTKGSLNRIRTNLSDILEDKRGHGESQYLEYDGSYLRLKQQRYTTDLQAFQMLKQRGELAEKEEDTAMAHLLYQRAFHLYRGEYMKDVYKAYDWHQEKQARILDQYLSIIDFLARQAYEQRDYIYCIELCYSGLSKDFSSEDLMITLLMVLHDERREGEATRAVLRYLEAAHITTEMPDYQDDFVMQTYWHFWPHLR